ncbi:MAG TPA: DUF1569 domain-containing protein [Humisphaera sp.]
MPAPARRKLRFESIDDALAEVDRLATAERDGRLTKVGNWSLGQALNHMATWAEFAFDGYPSNVRPPWVLRTLLTTFRGLILNRGMTTGVKIPGIEGGTLGIEPIPTEQALPRFRAAMDRLRTETPPNANPLFGRLTREQWVKLNLRHAELHLGFQVPTTSADSPGR